MTAHGDLSSTLSDLERKLKDLERELAGAGGTEPTEAPPTDVRPEAAGPPPAAPGDPAQHDVVVPPPATGPVPPTTLRDPAGFRGPADTLRGPADTLRGPAHELRDPAAGQMVADAEQSFGSLDCQLDELVRFREQLEGATRQLTEDYDRLLRSLRRPEPGTAPRR